MQRLFHTTKAQSRHHRVRPYHATRQPQAAAPASAGLSRAQLREIVLEQLG